MASAANRRQIATIAMFEALVDMLDSQGLHDDDYFQSLRESAKRSCDIAYDIMRRDKNGGLSQKDIPRIDSQINTFGLKAFERFSPERAISFCISLISDQTTICNNQSKKQIFERMLTDAENILVYFDPDCSYSEPDGFDAAQIFEELSI